MISLHKEPLISVGIIENRDRVGFEIYGTYLLDGVPLPAGRYEARANKTAVTLLSNSGKQQAQSQNIHLVPAKAQPAGHMVLKIKIGKDFHWERFQNQRFQGEMLFSGRSGNITVVNKICLEKYLGSVISSEMSPASPAEFLKAHCVISRSWVLAQVNKKKSSAISRSSDSRVSWTESGVHRHFDVCANDHCQRYHGIGQVNSAVEEALNATRGEILSFNDAICDTRFSKCCGGITERFSTAWGDRDVPYLEPVTDRRGHESETLLPVCGEADARRFIYSDPPVYCNVKDRAILALILPDFDFETRSFFRWQVDLSQGELGLILLEKTGIDFGTIKEILPIARGPSGRIYRLMIRGEKTEEIFGKELEIRRILFHTHLYSSAFVVERRGEEGFRFKGAGWGHGVGLCQTGAAFMALQGFDYKKILNHYFRKTNLKKIY